jgi:hypothetical protein
MKNNNKQSAIYLVAALIVGSTAFASGCNDETTGLTLGAASSCGDNAVMCAQGCTNIKVDAQNCGSCGHACETDEACVNGSCTSASSICTSSSQKYCMGSCVDVKSNPTYCGDCNTKCKDNESCKDGNCVVGCANNYTLCDGVCYNLLRDAEHCGDCDNACGSNMFCIGGGCKCQNGYFDCNNNPGDGCESEQACGHTLTCESEDLKCGDKCCLSGETCCGETTCVNTQTDAMHCGGCNADPCGDNQKCVDGSCQDIVVDCEDPNTQACHGECVDFLIDDKNCGRCGNICGPDKKCETGDCVDKNPAVVCNAPSKMCYGVCTDITSDDKNCGECLNECGESESCVNSRCELQCGELTNCGGACVSTKTSANHCGDCTTVCADGQACSGGTCGCAAGRYDCDGNTANGCESTTQCACKPGTKQACWRGDEANRHKGICTDGEQICDDSGQFWGTCTGGVYPSLITCDEKGKYIGGDQNCNGIADNTETCTTKCDLMLSDSSYIGCEYWAAYTHNHATAGEFSVILSNMNDEDAKITIYKGSDSNQVKSVTIPNGTVQAIGL